MARLFDWSRRLDERTLGPYVRDPRPWHERVRSRDWPLISTRLRVWRIVFVATLILALAVIRWTHAPSGVLIAFVFGMLIGGGALAVLSEREKSRTLADREIRQPRSTDAGDGDG